ncbi:MAG: sterol desaturase family protein [Bacteroidota bacterium]|nr:sterol desaturase family protein [Bacteroidota bacterium]
MTIFPVHISAFMLVTLLVLLLNVLGHLGFEFVPQRLRAGTIGSLFTSSTHHNLHHSRVHFNFGYYFTFWDKWMQTLHKDTFQ